MKKKISVLTCVLLSTLLLASCGKDPALEKFKKDIDSFCTEISNIDSAINEAGKMEDTDAAVTEVLQHLDDLEAIFVTFAELDFPEEFDYLEVLADESSEYMTEAVSYYHEAYSNSSYNEYTAEYATENYKRAFKRVQIIITFLHGDVPEDVDLVMESTEVTDTAPSAE